MIKLSDALLTDCIPAVVGVQPWAIAISAAVREQIRTLTEYAKRIRLYAAIPDMPEEILDVMAKEMRVPQYSEEYPISTKRALVSGAMTYWSKAGTKRAVEDLCSDIFGDATVVEWYEYGKDVGYFKVQTSNPAITDENVGYFKAAVESIKRLSAWLDKIELVLSTGDMNQYYGFSVQTLDFVALTQAE